jgi:hypothetical protein
LDPTCRRQGQKPLFAAARILKPTTYETFRNTL